MANIAHKNLIDPDIHEPKDISTALVGSAYIADGIGGGSWSGVAPIKTVLVNTASDFPTAVAGVITLLANTRYLLGDDVSVGTDRFVMAANTAVTGIESVVVTLTYTGTGDMFTILNTRNRINMLSISCVNGRIFNFSDNTDSIFRMIDCSVACATFGLFNSAGTNGSTTRFTNVSPSSITVGGCTMTGGWNTWLWETSATNITGGSLFDFGAATFDSIILDLILANLGAGTNLIKGAAASANINTGGGAIITRMLTSGAGTILNTITTDDILWVFSLNDDIIDTHPDALLSLTSNATATTLSVGVPTLVAGTWVNEGTSHFTATAAGRATYNGEKDIAVPMSAILTIDVASGTNKSIRAYVALDGTAVTNSGHAVNISAGDPKQITVTWQADRSTTEFVEPFIENETDSTNATVIDGTLRVN